MTHMRSYDEHEGAIAEPEATDLECRRCGKKEVTRQEWESHEGDFEDYKYTCGACKFVWWVDGIDS